MSAAAPPIVTQLREKVALVGVFLIKSTSEFLGIKHGETLDEMKWGAQSTAARSEDQPNTIRVRIGVMVVMLARARAVARVTCDFSLDYEVSDADLFARLTDSDFGAFGATNGFYNAWPFARELCRDLTARMPLPHPVLLPVATASLDTGQVRPWGDFGDVSTADA
jgi:hypothetical protein